MKNKAGQMFRQILIPLLIFAFFIFFYVKSFERRNIYYPTKKIELTPAAVAFQYEDVFFTAADGVRLNGWFIPKENPRGTLLFCHGNAGNIGHRLASIEIFHGLNLNVFIFDYRGYGKSQGSPSEAGLYQDARAAWYHLLNRKNIDQGAIIIYGESLGANVAVDLASKVKARALIFEGGFTSAYEMGRKFFPYLPIKWMISAKYDSLSKIKDIAIPKLIIHSRDDEIVPLEMGKRLFEAAPEPKEFYQLRGGHNEALLLAGEDYGLRIGRFLDRYL